MLKRLYCALPTLLNFRTASKRAMSSHALPSSSISIFTTVSGYREWRRKAQEDRKSVGFVATMGALHDGHISLVRRSLAENDLTVVSIFVNPAQFAPHEDLATYPRILPHDLEVLSSLSVSVSSSTRTPSALFLPSVSEMYPSGISQDVSEQEGTFVEVKGYGHQMEGARRPDFFRGVATVVTKLFNVIEPTRSYFGQKDIQQALLLRRMTRDLLLSHPTHENLFIVPTARDSASELALSSRNAYLTPSQKDVGAPTLYTALLEAKHSWEKGLAKEECISRAYALVENNAKQLASGDGEKAEMRLDYIEMNDPDTFEVIDPSTTRAQWTGLNSNESATTERPVILSGAMWIGRTRLIDNIVLGDVARLGIV